MAAIVFINGLLAASVRQNFHRVLVVSSSRARSCNSWGGWYSTIRRGFDEEMPSCSDIEAYSQLLSRLFDEKVKVTGFPCL